MPIHAELSVQAKFSVIYDACVPYPAPLRDALHRVVQVFY